MTDVKGALHAKLQQARGSLLARLDGLGEHDLRRPMTPTGTNLLGLVKHLIGVEHVYLGESRTSSSSRRSPTRSGLEIWPRTNRSAAR